MSEEPGDEGLSGVGGDGDGTGAPGVDPAQFGRVLVAVVVAVLVAVVGATLLAPSPATSAPEPVDLETSEFAVEAIATSELPAEGEIRPSADGSGTVVFDDAHQNDYQSEDVASLERAFARAGYDVRYHDRGDIAEALSGADAYVVVAPATEFSDSDVEAVRNFTDRGGRVVVFGEPNVRTVTTSGFGSVSVETERRTGDRLLRQYGLSFSATYVYSQRHNDGGFKNPVAVPAGPAADVGDRVPLYTAARVVRIDDAGEVVLRHPDSSRLAATDRPGEFAAAVRSGNVLAVGDATLLSEGRYNVADNEAFIAFVVDFLLSEELSLAPGDRDDAD